MNNRLATDEFAVLKTDILTEEQIKYYVKQYFIESYKYNREKLSKSFFKFIINSNNPYFRSLSQNLSVLKMLCETWFGKSWDKDPIPKNDMYYLNWLFRDNLLISRQIYVKKKLMGYDLGLISKDKLKRNFIEIEHYKKDEMRMLKYRFLMHNRKYIGHSRVGDLSLRMPGKNTEIIARKNELFHEIVELIHNDKIDNCSSVFNNTCKINIAFLEYWGFVLTENPDKADLNRAKKYFGKRMPTNKDILEFGYIENNGTNEDEIIFKPKFMHPLFQSYFCARYLVSCALTDDDKESLFGLASYKHTMDTEFGYSSIYHFVSHNSCNEDYQQIWMFVEDLLKNNKDSLDCFPNITLNQLLDYMLQKHYEFIIQRVNNNELKISYVKSNDGLVEAISNYLELMAILKKYLVENHLSDEVLITDDKSHPATNITSQNKSTIDKILTWLGQIELWYTKQHAVQSKKINSFFFNQEKISLCNDNQIKDEMKIECALF